MPGTYHCLKLHLIFGTKHRERWLTPDIRPRVHEYLGGAVRGEGGQPLGIGGVEDHVHLLIGWRTDVAVADLVRNIKSGSSRWIHQTFPELSGFAWQEGYGVFSVSESQVDKVRKYIRMQEEHHRERTFQEEFEAFLKAHGIEHESRYLWD
jgi:REP element-mobilizing transposase RayT